MIREQFDTAMASLESKYTMLKKILSEKVHSGEWKTITNKFFILVGKGKITCTS